MQHAMRKVCENNRKGFTLLEMMVVLSLVIILTIATAVYNKGIGRQIVIVQQHAKVLGMLVEARSSGFTIPKTTQPTCGYGVHVDAGSRTLIFFGDLCASGQANQYDAGEEIKQIVLDSSVTVTSSMNDVVFMPPFGNVLIDNTITTVEATIIVSSASECVNKQIKINSYGQITERDLLCGA